MPYRVTVQIHFCYGHRLLDYDGACAHHHGHNGLVEIQLESDTLDGRGMVFDFGDVKRDVKAWIDATMDHQMILRKDDPLVAWLEEQGEPFLVLADNPTAENIARLSEVDSAQPSSEGIRRSQRRTWPPAAEATRPMPTTTSCATRPPQTCTTTPTATLSVNRCSLP